MSELFSIPVNERNTKLMRAYRQLVCAYDILEKVQPALHELGIDFIAYGSVAAALGVIGAARADLKKVMMEENETQGEKP